MIWNTDLIETLELQNLLTNATVPTNPGWADDSKRLFLQQRGRNLVVLMLVRISLNGTMRIG